MYEIGMSVQWDGMTGQVTVTFRGERHVLPGAYRTRDEGMAAGEAYCRSRGWRS